MDNLAPENTPQKVINEAMRDQTYCMPIGEDKTMPRWSSLITPTWIGPQDTLR